jgi:hypothetical protein
MDEATQTLSSPPPRANPPLAPSAVITTAAMYRARQQIKSQLKARGEKVALLPARHLTLLAEQYLADHRAELIAQAWAWIMASPELRALYEREQRKKPEGLICKAFLCADVTNEMESGNDSGLREGKH